MEVGPNADEEKAMEAKMAAAEAFDSGDFETAVAKFSEAIEVHNLHAG